MNTIVINGKSYKGGQSVVVVGNRVIIDGKDMTPDAKEIRIEVHGNVERLEVDACSYLKVDGNVHTLSTVSGDVECGDVGGSVKTTSGDVKCKAVSGSVETTSGDVSASKIGGRVQTVSGNIN